MTACVSCLTAGARYHGHVDVDHNTPFYNPVLSNLAKAKLNTRHHRRLPPTPPAPRRRIRRYRHRHRRLPPSPPAEHRGNRRRRSPHQLMCGQHKITFCFTVISMMLLRCVIQRDTAFASLDQWQSVIILINEIC